MKRKSPVFSTGWHQEGNPACETWHQISLLHYQGGNWLSQVYLQKWLL